MRVISLDHLVLTVRCIETTCAFYSSVLRMVHQERRGETRLALPGLDEVGDDKDGQARHRDPAQPGR
jgi:hypothetical protein